MKLYLLERNVADLERDVGWCEARAMVIRAEDETAARDLAQKAAEDGDVETGDWRDPVYATCNRLMEEGAPGVIVFDAIEC